MTKRVKYSFEYNFRARALLLYNYISVPYNLSTWFADDVQVNGDILTLSWSNSSERIKIEKQIMKKKAVYKWLDHDAEEYLTFHLETDDVTGGTMLLVSDYDDDDQIDEAKMWWDGAIKKLKRVIGG